MTNCHNLIKGEWCAKESKIENDCLVLTSRCMYVLLKIKGMDKCLGSGGMNKPSRYISKSIRYEVLNRQKWNCNTCGKHLKYSEKHEYGDVVAHIDHIVPFSNWETYDGDINESSNLEALCPDCNLKKHSKNGF